MDKDDGSWGWLERFHLAHDGWAEVINYLVMWSIILYGAWFIAAVLAAR